MIINLESLREMKDLLIKHKISHLTQNDIENLNRPITRTKFSGRLRWFYC